MCGLPEVVYVNDCVPHFIPLCVTSDCCYTDAQSCLFFYLFFYSCSFPTLACNQTAAVTPETCVGSCSTRGIDQESMTESEELQPYGGFTMPLKSMFLSFPFAFLCVPAAFRRMDREIQSLIFKREGVTRSNAAQRFSTWAFRSNYSRRFLIPSISVLFISPIWQRKNSQSAF